MRHNAPAPHPRQQARRFALALLALFLFSPPILLIVDRLPGILGWLPLYLFLAWGWVIGLAAWLAKRPKQP
ncbi:hypothetical protein [Halomonas sp. BL6]|uniref:hypothetical protein n=1 Tax=Halomonas sp. BL6 TaxID=2585770 RepID=UPI001117ED6A|nr:hypothetical protein [Halomonas sp. BL6]TNH15894.1 hypothetical protein FHJ80_12030 [Halomonas sp. BL6]